METYPLDGIEKDRKEYFEKGGKGRLVLVKGWWIKDQPPPPVKLRPIKGHWMCPCGSMKKFRNCCRGKKS